MNVSSPVFGALGIMAQEGGDQIFVRDSSPFGRRTESLFSSPGVSTVFDGCVRALIATLCCRLFLCSAPCGSGGVE